MKFINNEGYTVTKTQLESNQIKLSFIKDFFLDDKFMYTDKYSIIYSFNPITNQITYQRSDGYEYSQDFNDQNNFIWFYHNIIRKNVHFD